jgi:hypothetical protein
MPHALLQHSHQAQQTPWSSALLLVKEDHAVVTHTFVCMMLILEWSWQAMMIMKVPMVPVAPKSFGYLLSSLLTWS